MLRLLSTRRWLAFTATALVAIVAFGLLSRWQWARAAEESAASSIVTINVAREPVPLAALVSPGDTLPADLQWRTVTVTGEVRCSAGVLVRNRPLDGANGLWAACPLVAEDGATVWINRGWLPAGNAATQVVPMPPWADGTATITGRVRPSEQGPPEQPTDLPAGQVTHLDTASLGPAAPGAPLYLPYIDVTGSEPTDPAGLEPIPLELDQGYQNVSYALQWLVFAAIAVGGWFYFLRREARETAESPEPAAQPAAHS